MHRLLFLSCAVTLAIFILGCGEVRKKSEPIPEKQKEPVANNETVLTEKPAAVPAMENKISLGEREAEVHKKLLRNGASDISSTICIEFAKGSAEDETESRYWYLLADNTCIHLWFLGKKGEERTLRCITQGEHGKGYGGKFEWKKQKITVIETELELPAPPKGFVFPGPNENYIFIGNLRSEALAKLEKFGAIKKEPAKIENGGAIFKTADRFKITDNKILTLSCSGLDEKSATIKHISINERFLNLQGDLIDEEKDKNEDERIITKEEAFINLAKLDKPADISTPQKCWQAILNIMQNDDIKFIPEYTRIMSFSTKKGIESILRIKDEDESVEDLLMRLGKGWAKFEFRIIKIEGDRAEASMGPEEKAHSLKFIKVDGDWLFDEWLPGE